MAHQEQAVDVSQPSGTIEQTETRVEIPLSVSNTTSKGKKSSRTGQKKAVSKDTTASDALVAAAFSETLADRIKAGSGRRRTTQSKACVPSAAVTALADAVDTALAPEEGVTELYLDSRDADHNVLDDIPGASAEQKQHALQNGSSRSTQDAAGPASSQPAPDSHQNGVVKAKKSKKQKKDSSGDQPALLQAASQLAQGPSSTTDVLEEDDQIMHRRRARQQVQVEDATQHALSEQLPSNGASSTQDTSNVSSLTTAPGTPLPELPKRKRKAKAEAEPNATAEDTLARAAAVPSDDSAADQTAASVPLKKHKRQSKAKSANPVEVVAAAVSAVAGDVGQPGKKKPKRQKVKATELAVDTETQLVDAAPEGKRSNRKKKEVQLDEVDADVKGTAEGAHVSVTKKTSRAKAVNQGPVFELPSRNVLQTALQWKATPRPVPNLGYACLNMDLREQKPPIFTNRDLRQATMKQKGMSYVSQLALENVSALKGIIQWNHEHGIRFFRMTSTMLPFCTYYNMEDLPDFPAIADELAFVGKLARAYQQRLTFHPSHFVKVAAPKEDLVQKSLKELEVHSQILDLMGYEPSHWNKVNIHIGGVYEDKQTTLDRFAQNFARLSDNCKARLTLENDDWGSAFSVKDLLPLSKKCNIPIVFDFHHHKFCSGDWSEKEAFFAALGTWPEGIRPAVHWSESQDNRKAFAHSDYIYGPMNLHGKEADVDVMIEAKCKERTLLQFRDQTMLGIGPMEQPSFLQPSIVNPASELASKFL